MEKPLYKPHQVRATKLKHLHLMEPGEESKRLRQEMANSMTMGGVVGLVVIVLITIILHYCESIDQSPAVPIVILAAGVVMGFYKLFKL